METIHAHGTPLAAYLEGEGHLETQLDQSADRKVAREPSDEKIGTTSAFAPPNRVAGTPHFRRSLFAPLQTHSEARRRFSRIHDAWSTAVNSRIGRADNARFIEHFRYIIVASQLLDEYLDQGAIQPVAPTNQSRDDAQESGILSVTTTPHGAAATAAVAFALVYLIHWTRSSRGGVISTGRVAIALVVFTLVALVGYAYLRRQWLKFLRRNAVAAASSLTASWQTFEMSSSSALSLIQEVELVSKGYKLSTPLPPASRIEENGTLRRCVRLRKALHKAYAVLIPAAIEACETLGTLIDEDDIEKYFEIYDVNAQDAKEASGVESIGVLEDDPESLKSLRVLSYREGVLRRVTLCSLMSLEADAGKPDFHRWRSATEVMERINAVVGSAAERLRQQLSEMETLNIPKTPVARMGHTPTREKMRSQVRKISALSSGIRGLQAKMQVLREETNRSIEHSEDLTDLGPSLMAQYDSIGADLKDLMQSWETGKASLQTNLTKQEHRLSLASSGLRSPVSSLGGLTAVEESSGTPDDALNTLNGRDETRSDRSSLGPSPSPSPSSDGGGEREREQVFEAIAMPRRRAPTLTREERILKVHEERERQATVRAKRESNTNMLRELESVINLRPKKEGMARVTSL